MAWKSRLELQGFAKASSWVTLTNSWVSISMFLKYFPLLQGSEVASHSAQGWVLAQWGKPSELACHSASPCMAQITALYPFLNGLPLISKKGDPFFKGEPEESCVGWNPFAREAKDQVISLRRSGHVWSDVAFLGQQQMRYLLLQ